jgi:DNA polymerase-4
MQKPDGLTIIHQHEIVERFAQLEPRDFPGIGPRMEQRFHAYGCFSARQLYQLTPREMKQIWGGVVGERFFELIRGINLPDQESERSSISHSKVLAPDLRTPQAAWPVAVRLLTKACARLRGEQLYSRELGLSIKYIDRDPAKQHWRASEKSFETQDSLLLLEHLEKLWRAAPSRTILRVGITLSQLTPAARHQPSLFEDAKRNALMSALDSVNARYSDGALFIADSYAARSTSTTAIAFQHIPDESD